MTAKRVTIGAKPVLVHRETDIDGSAPSSHETGDLGASPVEPATNREQEPASAEPSSIEDWLRQGDAVESARTEPASSELAPSEPAPSKPVYSEPAPAADGIEIETLAMPETVHATPAAASSEPVKGKVMPPLPPWAGIAGGAVAGAAVAFAVVFLMPRFMPTTDLRLSPLTERVALLENGLRGTGEQIGRLNNEISQTLDDQSAAVTRLDRQAEDITGLRQALTTDIGRVDPVIDVSSPVFAVALGQLRTTFYTGRPFEAELVNVYAIAGTNELFAPYLTELAEPARTGMPNAAELRRVFPSYVAAAGLRIGDSASYFGYGLSLVNRYVGLATEPYAVEEANLAVTRADAQLATGDVESAVATLRDMGAIYTVPMQPWFDAARNYVRAETAITEMTRVVVDRLRQKVGQEMGAPTAEPAAIEPAAEPAPVTVPAAP